jgi:hypothetical protein
MSMMVPATGLVNDYGAAPGRLRAALPTVLILHAVILVSCPCLVFTTMLNIFKIQYLPYFLTSGFGGNSILANR